MNRKLMSKIIGGEKRRRLADAELLEADDGESALEMLRSEMQAGRRIDFVLMDFVMVAVVLVVLVVPAVVVVVVVVVVPAAEVVVV